jgi:hypothetical protein
MFLCSNSTKKVKIEFKLNSMEKSIEILYRIWVFDVWSTKSEHDEWISFRSAVHHFRILPLFKHVLDLKLLHSIHIS